MAWQKKLVTLFDKDQTPAEAFGQCVCVFVVNVLENTDLYNTVTGHRAKSLAMHAVERLFDRDASQSFKEGYTKAFSQVNLLLFMPTRDGVSWSMLDALFSSGDLGTRVSSGPENHASSPSGSVILPEDAQSPANSSSSRHVKVPSPLLCVLHTRGTVCVCVCARAHLCGFLVCRLPGWVRSSCNTLDHDRWDDATIL